MFKFCKTNHKKVCLLFVTWLFYQPAIGLDLMEVVDYVLDTHPAILANEKSVDVSKYNYYQTFGQFFPEVNIRRDQNREISNNGPNGESEKRYLNASTDTFQLTQNLFAGFKDWHANRAALWRYMSTKENVVFNINSTVLDTISVYISVLQQEKLLNLAKENKDFFQKILANSQKLFESGTTDKADFLLVKNNLQNADATLLEAQKNYDSAVSKFKYSVNLEPKNLAILKTISGHISDNLQQLIEFAVKHNSNIQETEAKIKALEHELKGTAGDFMPSLDMLISKSQSANIAGLPGKSADIKIGVSASLDLFKGGQSYIAIQSKTAEKLSLTSQLDATIRNLKQDISETLLNINNTIQKKKSIEEQILSAEQSLQSYLTLFDYNQVYLLNVLNAKKLLFTSQNESIINNSNKLIYEHRMLLLNNTLISVLNEVYFKANQ
ncbi:MAG: TolC family protein [Gammaproteobacteria bacterium]|jgi:outer membrane protein TolC